MSYLEYNQGDRAPSLESAWPIAKEALRDFATGPNFLVNLETVFGNGLDSEKAVVLAADWGAGDFSGLPEIEVRPSSEINGAMGAFSGDTNTIYFSQEYLNAASDRAVARVWLEEIGHFVDSVVNSSDAVGDEGDIFSRLVRGEVLDELELLRSEDDRATVVLDGVEVAIEMATKLSGDGATVDDAIDPAFDEDTFTFKGKAGEIITLGADNRTTSGGLRLKLLNPDGSFLSSTIFKTFGDPEINRIQLPANGTYTAIVDGNQSDTGEYTLGLSNLSQDSAASLSGDGATVDGMIDFIFDEDIFTFKGKAGNIITLGADNRTTSGGLRLILLNPNGSFLSSTIFKTFGDPEINRIQLPTDGTYTAIVDGNQSDTGEYTLGLSNLSQNSAASLSGDGATVDGTIDFIFDEDIFTFKGKAGDIITLGADNLTTSGGLRLILLNPDGSELSSTIFKTFGDPEINRIQLPANGTYTAIVDGNQSDTGEYTLGLSNLSQDSAASLSRDRPTVNGKIDFIFDEDIFTFKGKAGEAISLGVDNRTTSGGLRLILLNPDGSELSSTIFKTFGDPEINRIQLPTDGTYTAIVDGNQSDTGEYTLSVLGLSSRSPTDPNNEPSGTSGKDNINGSGKKDTINGKGGNDKINGGGGNDKLLGGAGNDNLNGGTGKDRLNGGSGKDRLDGGKGADILNGGGGNDTYIIDNPKDKILEKRGGGTDTVQTSININNNIFNNVENIVFTGTRPLKGTGDNGKNRIVGNGGNNRIDGKGGNDFINGGKGNDNLLAGSGNDIINGGKGNDKLLGGAGNDTLIGGLGKDNLSGGGGNDRLTGDAGNDVLTGGGGKDRFIYESNRRFRTRDFGKDKIADFVIGQDDIVLDRTTFRSLESKAGNNLLANDFATIAGKTTAARSSAEIVYNSSTGELFYNANGRAPGFGGGGKFATLTNEPALSRSDFIVQN